MTPTDPDDDKPTILQPPQVFYNFSADPALSARVILQIDLDSGSINYLTGGDPVEPDYPEETE